METWSPTELGAGIYATLSLFNHSCDPAVTRNFYGARCVSRAVRGVGRGEEVSDNYGAVYAVQTREERVAKLAPQYYFECGCEACTGGWRLFAEGVGQAPRWKCDCGAGRENGDKEGGIGRGECRGKSFENNGNGENDENEQSCDVNVRDMSNCDVNLNEMCDDRRVDIEMDKTKRSSIENGNMQQSIDETKVDFKSAGIGMIKTAGQQQACSCVMEDKLLKLTESYSRYKVAFDRLLGGDVRGPLPPFSPTSPSWRGCAADRGPSSAAVRRQ